MNTYFLLTSELARTEAMKVLADVDLNKGLEVWFKKHKAQRSYQQNRLMWMWLDILSEETGHSPLDLHEILKVKFLGTETRVLGGEEFVIARSTTNLNTKEFTNYLEKMRDLGNTMDIRLPLPDDLRWAAFGAA